MVATKSALDKKQALSLVSNFFHAFSNCINHPTAPAAADFEKCLSRNFQISSNGHVRCKNLAEYLSRLQKLQQKYSHVELSAPLHDPIIADNKVVIVYNVELTPRAGKKFHLYFMVVSTVEDNKFVSWEQVTHAKGEAQWDS